MTTTEVTAAIRWMEDHHLRNATDVRSLIALYEAPGPTPIGRIAEEAGVIGATMTGVIDHFAKHGLTTRTPKKGDRRVQLVDLTAKGRKAFTAPITVERSLPVSHISKP